MYLVFFPSDKIFINHFAHVFFLFFHFYHRCQRMLNFFLLWNGKEHYMSQAKHIKYRHCCFLLLFLFVLLYIIFIFDIKGGTSCILFVSKWAKWKHELERCKYDVTELERSSFTGSQEYRDAKSQKSHNLAFFREATLIRLLFDTWNLWLANSYLIFADNTALYSFVFCLFFRNVLRFYLRIFTICSFSSYFSNTHFFLAF